MFALISYGTSPVIHAQSAPINASESTGQSPSEPVRLNKMHLNSSPAEQAAPGRVAIPSPLLRHARSTLLYGVNMGRSGTQCKMEGYTRFKYPEDAFVLMIQIADSPPIRLDATSVTYVNESSFRFVYPEGTRIIEFTAHYSEQGALLDMLPVDICEYSAPKGMMAQAPAGVERTIGLLAEEKIQRLFNSFP